jgi:hypothetical protein
MFTITTQEIARAYEERHGERMPIAILDRVMSEVEGRLDNLLDEILPAILDDAKDSEVSA